MSRTSEELLLEYRERKKTFEAFTDFCIKEVESALKEAGVWYQVVQGRTKSEESLNRKLKAETVQVKSVADIRDVSGVRVITYLDPELNKIQESLWWKRKIGRLRVVRIDGAYRDPGFFGRYVTLTVDETNCAGVPEEFKGLKCELQLTTILQHGWAEVYHRSVRSVRDELRDLSEDQVRAIERKYEEMVKGPLREAGDNLHFLYQHAKSLKRGAEYKLEDPVGAISKATNLNEMHEGLVAVDDSFERFGGLIPGLTRALPKLISYRSLLSSLPAVPKIVSGMDFRGASKHQCLRELLKVTRLLGYTNIGAFLRFLFQVWKEEPDVRNECESQLREFLEWNIRNLRAWGYAAHLEIAKELDSLHREAKEGDWMFFLISAEHLLKFQLEGAWESDLNKITVPFGCIRIDDELASIRQIALSWLRIIAFEATDTKLKAHALRSLFAAVDYPVTPRGTIPEANELVKSESDSLLDALELKLPSMSFPELIHALDHCRDLASSYGREGLSPDRAKGITDLIEKDPRFIRFQELVGTVHFENTAKGNFEEEFSRWEEAKKRRSICGRELGLTISESNWNQWKPLILEICSFEGALGIDRFDAFEELLRGLCQASPKLASELITSNIEQVGRFSSRIICELFESENANEICPALLENLKAGLAVSDIAHGIFWSKKMDVRFAIDSIAAIDVQSFPDSVGLIVDSLTSRNTLTSADQEKTLVAIESLAKIHNFSWFRLFSREHVGAFRSFSSEQWNRLLQCLVHLPRLDYHVEEILLAAAEKDTVPVLDFLLERLKVGRNRKDPSDVYDAQPRRMHRLASVLEGDMERITKRLIEEFAASDYIGRQFYAGALIVALVPLNSPTLSTWLNSLADSKQAVDHELLLEALGPYGNSALTHPYYRRLISNRRCNRKLWSEIASRLLHVQVASGEDGMLNQLRSFSSLIASWDDTDELIRQFKETFANKARTSVEIENANISRERVSSELRYEMRTGRKPGNNQDEEL